MSAPLRGRAVHSTAIIKLKDNRYDDTTSLEVKSADGEAHRAFDEFLTGFEAFGETNDRRLAEIEHAARPMS